MGPVKCAKCLEAEEKRMMMTTVYMAQYGHEAYERENFRRIRSRGNPGPLRTMGRGPLIPWIPYEGDDGEPFRGNGWD